MATAPPPPNKKQRLAAGSAKFQDEQDRHIPDDLDNVNVQFVDQSTGQPTGGPVSIPLTQATIENLGLLLNSLKDQERGDNLDKVPYKFLFQPNKDPWIKQDVEITSDLFNSIIKPGIQTREDLIRLNYIPQSIFRVRAVTRCSASISGHGQAILATQFSPTTASRMISGSGDGNARIWDCDTGTPFQTLEGHSSWVLAVSYAPDGSMVATGSMDNTVRVWETETGKPKSSALRGHRKWITALAWEPFHLQAEGRPRLASSSKDATVRIWDAISGRADLTLTRHSATVSCVKWGGTGNVYTSSHDRTVMIFNGTNGSLLRTITSHAHWVNHLALSSDHVLRTAYLDPIKSTTYDASPTTFGEKRAIARVRFEQQARYWSRVTERFVTASDDCTMFLWNSENLSKPVARLLGHQKQVNHVVFSPDGEFIASSGFDNAVRLWRARDGSFVKTLRGHVGAVYQSCFSADSRLLASASADTTVKVWDVSTGKLLEDLPGHKDEVYAVDWSPNGKRVASGGKDKLIRLWTN